MVLRNTLRRETEWLRRGAAARTTKQQARIARAGTLGDEVAELGRRNLTRTATLDFAAAEARPRRLIEARGIAKTYDGRPIFEGIDLRLGPGVRVGLLGPNGCGKSTLIRVLLGEEEPSAGTVVRADGLQVAYFQQSREALEPDRTLADTLCPDGDYVTFRGARVHVRGYLERFLFEHDQMQMPVGKLSGGEQSRLLLAQLMLREAQLLVLDEPTNDLGPADALRAGRLADRLRRRRAAGDPRSLLPGPGRDDDPGVRHPSGRAARRDPVRQPRPVGVVARRDGGRGEGRGLGGDGARRQRRERGVRRTQEARLQGAARVRSDRGDARARRGRPHAKRAQPASTPRTPATTRSWSRCSPRSTSARPRSIACTRAGPSWKRSSPGPDGARLSARRSASPRGRRGDRACRWRVLLPGPAPSRGAPASSDPCPRSIGPCRGRSRWRCARRPGSP